MNFLKVQDPEVGWMNPQVLIVCGVYVVLFAVYISLAFAAVKKKSWRFILGSIAINSIFLLLVLQLGFSWGGDCAV
jgi:hypothetical protein